MIVASSQEKKVFFVTCKCAIKVSKRKGCYNKIECNCVSPVYVVVLKQNLTFLRFPMLDRIGAVELLTNDTYIYCS